MSTSAPKPLKRVWLCRSGDCRGAKGHDALREALVDAGVSVRAVNCQDICKGPVVGLKINRELRWYKRLRGRALRQALIKSVERGAPTTRLKAQEVRKRRGKLR